VTSSAKVSLFPRLVVVGPVVCLLIDVQLRLQAPRYRILHNAASDYGVGRLGWVMNFNFLLRGGGQLLFV